MKSFLLIFIYLLSVQFSQAQWQPQISGTNKDLNSVSFIDENTGWVCGADGTLLFTSNSGQSWELLLSPTDQDMVSIHFANELKGWILLQSGETPFYSEVIFTNDGGSTWNTLLNLDKYCSKIFFIDELTGWLAGDGSIWKTMDGGLNWTIPSNGLPDKYYTNIYFMNAQNGWGVAATYNEAIAYKTTDGGEFWEEMILPEDGSMQSVFFINEYVGWITINDLYTTPNGIILKTTDGGNTWVNVFEEWGSWFMNIYFSDEYTGWVTGECSYYSLYQTNDGGLNWIPALDTYLHATFEIHAEDDFGWVVGQSGTIIYNDNLIVGLDETEDIDFSIDCFPNPFKSDVEIIVRNVESLAKISISIYNMEGKLINNIVENEIYPEGVLNFKWEANNHLGLKLDPGLYFINITINNQSKIKSVILLP